MFRASDVFGRKPGNSKVLATVRKEAAGIAKRPPGAADGANKVWDPATGEYIYEELPADISSLLFMGTAAKKLKTEVKSEAQAWGQSLQEKKTWLAKKALGPGSVGLHSAKHDKRKPHAGDVDKAALSVEYRGFQKAELNDRYYEKKDVQIHGRQTYWNSTAEYFLYWQGEVQRWALCDSSSWSAVRAGQYPGWAYRSDARTCMDPRGWKEAWDGEWREPSLEVTTRATSSSAAVWDTPELENLATSVEFRGWTMKELNTKFILREHEKLQGRPSLWDETGVYFIYWQKQTKRWAICDLKCLEAVRAGQCPGWGYRLDSGHYANANGWMERRADEWSPAILEASVSNSCTQGLKVDFHGFSKTEMNGVYSERPDIQVQGKVTFWDATETFFVYWQSSFDRWAICDKMSLPQCSAGLSPGWAYRTNSHHFTRSRGWMEVDGRDWKRASVTCTLIEGRLSEDQGRVKLEKTDIVAGRDASSANRYKQLILQLYQVCNPDKLKDVSKLLEKYQGREQELYHNICEKYEVDADEFALQAGADEDQENDDDLPHLERVECPALTREQYAILVQSIYERKNPKKLGDMGRLLDKYKHDLRELYHLVCNKYSLHPAKYHARNEDLLQAGQQEMRAKAEMN
eukprot:TRINITY_DN5577_c0_g1_i6.p1 TRINITY_DN5577_c0_g1~~TRINITY_DN5577_c0_g1_i6.p1  ORF type:complete len:633 (-),score=116.02 TRINITY_DN5577_c0_g1_i6:2-1900(-)